MIDISSVEKSMLHSYLASGLVVIDCNYHTTKISTIHLGPIYIIKWY